MANAGIILGLLVVPYLVATVFNFNQITGGRVGLCAVFFFTALGHFLKTESMLEMLPPFVPARRALIYLSGVVEILFAVALVVLPNPAYVGWMVILYLIVVFPSNIYAAVHRIQFGGHSIGPRYLFARVPLQVLLIGWTYWFAVRGR